MAPASEPAARLAASDTTPLLIAEAERIFDPARVSAEIAAAAGANGGGNPAIRVATVRILKTAMA